MLASIAANDEPNANFKSEVSAQLKYNHGKVEANDLAKKLHIADRTEHRGPKDGQLRKPPSSLAQKELLQQRRRDRAQMLVLIMRKTQLTQEYAEKLCNKANWDKDTALQLWQTQMLNLPRLAYDISAEEQVVVDPFEKRKKAFDAMEPEKRQVALQKEARDYHMLGQLVDDDLNKGKLKDFFN